MKGRPPIAPRIDAVEARLAKLEELVSQVMADYEAGLLRSEGPIERRGKHPHRDPQTAIIAEAAQRVMAEKAEYKPLFDRWPGNGR